MAKIHFKTLGCRLNLAESERMARGFRLAGHEVVTDGKLADIRVINTCTVTKNAGDDSRKAARPLHAEQKIVVTGCHSELHPDEFSSADYVLPIDQKEEIEALVKERFGLEGLSLGMDVQKERQNNVYPLALSNTRAFVKIQDGCNMRCSFCLTTVARGVSRSRTAEDIILEIDTLSNTGCQEAVLTGVHAGSYGLDLDQDLGWLVERILSETSIPRLRLSSLEPWNFKSEWIVLWKRFGHRLCRHLHMSLQSGSNSVLRRMNRHYDDATYKAKIDLIRAAIPDMGFTTDIIVGFPGETEAEHQETLAFAQDVAFAGAHIFSYSKRPGTQAAEMPDQIDPQTKKQRFAEMKAVIAASEKAFADRSIGTEQMVLWETVEKSGRLRGLTDHYLRIFTEPSLAQPNSLTMTRIQRWQNEALLGEPCDEQA